MQEVQLQLQDRSDSDLLGCSSSDLRSHDALVSRFGFVGAEGASAGEDNNVRERGRGRRVRRRISFAKGKRRGCWPNHHQVFFVSKRDDRNSFASSIPVSTIEDFSSLWKVSFRSRPGEGRGRMSSSSRSRKRPSPPPLSFSRLHDVHTHIVRISASLFSVGAAY